MDPQNGLERLVPELLAPDDDLGRTTLGLHVARYEFAARWVHGRTVLDLACGSGYGSALLAQRGAAHVVGVDLSPDAIAYARATYGRPNVEFVVAGAYEFIPPSRFDVAVTLETIEHLPDPRRFVRRLATLVVEGGMIVGSAPTTLSSDVNPFHLHDLGTDELRDIFRSAGLEIVDELVQRQRILLGKLVRRSGEGHFALRRGLARYYASHPAQAVRRMTTLARHGLWNEYLVIAARCMTPDRALPD